jgi:trans-aconitate methyltransferase
MVKKKATEIFSQWAISGKDIGMETNHFPAVDVMLDHLIGLQTSPFSIIDAGCGNGWVIRKISGHSLCERAIGVDGALEMIEKARSFDGDGQYFHSDLLEWVPNEKVDYVHSMEVLYYFKQPDQLILHIVENWMNRNGTMIMGMDYYEENLKSHSWPENLNTYMAMLSIDDWITLFNDCGLSKVTAFQTNADNDFPGTLVIKGKKK